MRLIPFCIALVVVLAATSGGLAQKTLADIQAEVSAGSGDLAQIDSMLTDPDGNKRIAAMVALLASGNPVFIQRAKEVGFTSSDPALQIAVLKATLDAAGPLRIDVDFSDVEGEPLKEWQKHARDYGTLGADGKSATYMLNLETYDPERRCYPVKGAGCYAWLDGTALTIGISNASVSTRMDTSGALSGAISSQYIDQAAFAMINFLD